MMILFFSLVVSLLPGLVYRGSLLVSCTPKASFFIFKIPFQRYQLTAPRIDLPIRIND